MGVIRRIHDYNLSKIKRKTPGAITFLRAVRGPFNSGAEEELAELRRRGVRDLVVVHGTAFEHDGKTVLITGPAGVGKTSAVNALGKRVIEDGIVLLSKEGNGYRVLPTGTADYSQEYTRTSRELRGRLGLLQAGHLKGWRALVSRGVSFFSKLAGAYRAKPSAVATGSPKLDKVLFVNPDDASLQPRLIQYGSQPQEFKRVAQAELFPSAATLTVRKRLGPRELARILG
ncbi:hypothetical protein COT58_03265 [Candidatus Micrarchaeota archaeon CG09_land_8_20_14_0_10_60_16]|nr:MAG: hypothetical protein COT58_03265 [Candidatus Micrarchaeota archaeon CG09_land_8_20_14_0_10_60_16]